MSSRLVCCGSSSSVTNTSSDLSTNTNNTTESAEKCGVCMEITTSSSRRKKICSLCLQSVCISCIPVDPRSRNHKVCSICQIIVCSLSTRSDLEQLRTQHLVRFIDANRIDRRGCRDKSEIVELILRCRTDILTNRAAPSRNSLPPYNNPSHQYPAQNSISCNPMGDYASRSENRRQSHSHRSSNHHSGRTNSAHSSNSSNVYHNFFNGFQQSMSSLANGMSSLANQMAASAQSLYCPTTPMPNMGSSNGPLFQTTTTVLHPGGSSGARTMTTMTTRMTIHPDQRTRNRANNRTSAPYSHRRHQRPEPNVVIPPNPPIPTILLVEIKSQEDINRMTTRQMKELLDFHLVSTRGCIEQTDLREKVKELWEDEKEKRRLRDKGEKDGNDSDRSYICKICMDDVVDCVFVECGHMVTCLECGKKIKNCPVCRQNIVKVIKTFRS